MRKNIASCDTAIVNVPVWMLKTAEPFSSLFPVRETVLAEIIEDMNINGFDAGHPIVLWNMTIVDGHTRLRAAIAAGIEDVPVICRKFTDECDALEYAIRSQRNRRNLTDWELFQCLKKLDFRKKIGRPGINCSYQAGKSSDVLAEMLGISRAKIEKLRAIMDHGSDEVKDAIRQGKYSINGAYQAVMEPRRKHPDFLPDEDAEAVHSVMADIHSRLNEVQIRKLIKALQLEIANN